VKTILLVNESRVTFELIKVYLAVEDVRVLEAQDGITALNLAREQRPDLVLCDLHLPRLDGPQLCREVRADLALRTTPFIILSSDGEPATLRRCREAGVSGVLMKPIGPRELHDAVQRHAGISVGLAFTRPPKLDRAS
jgi:CheY-like chemotaxis protein